jgi:FkbM family methyltransferase
MSIYVVLKPGDAVVYRWPADIPVAQVYRGLPFKLNVATAGIRAASSDRYNPMSSGYVCRYQIYPCPKYAAIWQSDCNSCEREAEPMIARKSMRFLAKMVKNRPLDILPSIHRRAIEALTTAPTDGLATTYFGDVRFDVDMSLHAITRKYYYQTHEMFLNAIFRKFLKEGDTFIDIGANMGYWSALAAARVGKFGQVHAFEPVPVFFNNVRRLATNNPSYRIFPNNSACGSEPGRIEMAVVTPTKENYSNFDTNIGSSSALPGFLNHASELINKIQVPVLTLDSYMADNKIAPDKIGLIKIDVEGYESFCLDGMESLLRSTQRKVPILCEVLTDTKRHELLDAKHIIARMKGHGYEVFDATTLAPIDVETIGHEENILCI